MVAYTLPSDTDETAIRAGRRNALLAQPRRHGARNQHGGPGSRVHLSIARNRDTPIRRLPTMLNVLHAEAVFDKDGVQRLLLAEPLHPGTIEGVHALLLNAEQGSPHERGPATDRLAVALGFTDYAALWASIGGGSILFAIRSIIAWTPLS